MIRCEAVPSEFINQICGNPVKSLAYAIWLAPPPNDVGEGVKVGEGRGLCVGATVVVIVLVELTVVGAGEAVSGVGVLSTSLIVSCSGVGLRNSETEVGVFDADDIGIDSTLSGIQAIA